MTKNAVTQALNNALELTQMGEDGALYLQKILNITQLRLLEKKHKKTEYAEIIREAISLKAKLAKYERGEA